MNHSPQLNIINIIRQSYSTLINATLRKHTTMWYWISNRPTDKTFTLVPNLCEELTWNK